MSESENAWIFPLGKEARPDGFMIIVDHVSSDIRGIREGDALVIIEEATV